MSFLIPVLVCGPRDGTGISIVWNALDIARRHPEMPRFNFVVVGSRRGTDLEAFDWAMEHEMPGMIYPAKWKTGTVGGKPEGMIRNGDMYRDTRPQLVLGYPGGPGTAGMMSIAARKTPTWWWSQPDKLWLLDERSFSGQLPFG